MAFPYKDKTIFDVGCGDGAFANTAITEGAKEVWGCDHNPEHARNRESGFNCNFLEMPFSKIPAANPELKGKFDVVKITAVTPYANIHEIKHMMHTVHFLLKKEGHVFIELPWNNMMDKAFTATQKGYQTVAALDKTPVRLNNRDKKEILNLQSMYRQLIGAHFGSIKEFEGFGRVPTIIAGKPKEKIPAIDDIEVDTRMWKLKRPPSGTFSWEAPSWKICAPPKISPSFHYSGSLR